MIIPGKDEPQDISSDEDTLDEASSDHDEPVATYNIVLLGQTQAGKSNFIQGVRKYADPRCEIDHTTIGSGGESHTTEVAQYSVKTNFPEYHLYDSSLPIASEAAKFLDSCSFQEHRRMLDRVDGVKVRKGKASSYPRASVRIFDTPGLNDTQGHDEKNVANILSALSGGEAVHLVLIVMSRHAPMTVELQAALKTYSNIFSTMGGIIAFAHTKFDFKDHRIDNPVTTKFMDERKATLASVIGRDTPHFLIDCDLDEYRPVRNFLTQRAIRSILTQATKNVPVPLSRIHLHKTTKMMEIDQQVANGYQERLEHLKKEVIVMDKKIADIVNKRIADIVDVNSEIDNLTRRNQDLSVYLDIHDTEDLELVYEDHFYEEVSPWDIFGARQDKTLEKSLNVIIDHIEEDHWGLEVKEKRGGKGSDYWNVRVMRWFYNPGGYNVKLYTKRRNLHRQEIDNKKAAWNENNLRLGEWEKKRSKLGSEDGTERGSLKEKQDLLTKQRQIQNAFARASQGTLHSNLYQAIAKSGAYQGEISECVRKVGDFYMAYTPSGDEEAAME
ncbi:hypothetical protein BGZ99_006567 [Dissophora globulifera]|uniref:G domain-containing protein n=1 Tax=Dissophora globulifera TaxID=979702 RepID=A0A9P6REM8_9FUNG|nr:hypothetical protein BGZ99_006567 [Dissophora globulifera]